MRQDSLYFIGILFLLLLDIGVAIAEPSNQVPSDHQPKVCNGYDPENAKWGFAHYVKFENGELRCPKNYAYMSSASIGGPRMPARAITFLGNCCELPSADILTDRMSYEYQDCPEGSVAVGLKAKVPCSSRIPIIRYALCDDNEGYALICAEINKERYYLGPAQAGDFWGHSVKRWHEVSYVRKSTITPALRYALGRYSKYHWLNYGCVASPPGGLLTGKTTKRCRGTWFRSLLFKGRDGDPAKGVPVKIFPECVELEDRFSEKGSCVN